MAPVRKLVLTFLAWVSVPTNCEDSHVTCVVNETCVLPCIFTPAFQEVIHWHKEDIVVHSFYHGTNQLSSQNTRYVHRTSLFTDQIARGNASLQLAAVTVSDWGSYKCYTSTALNNQQSFVIVTVRAPVRSVVMEMINGTVSCSSQGGYPSFDVSWLTDPPCAPDALQAQSKSSQDSQSLYLVESRVRILGNLSDHTYVCMVTAADGTQMWTASLRRQEMIITDPGLLLALPCATPALRLLDSNHSLTWNWTFTGSHSAEPTIVATRHGNEAQVTVSDPWQDRVLNVSVNGSLLLQHLRESGTYTCTIRGPGATHQVQTWVNVKHVRTDNTLGVVGVVVVGVLVALVVGCLVFGVIKYRKGNRPTKEQVSINQENTPLQHLNTNGQTAEEQRSDCRGNNGQTAEEQRSDCRGNNGQTAEEQRSDCRGNNGQTAEDEVKPTCEQGHTVM